MSTGERKRDNFEALHSLFAYIDSVLSKTESFPHTLDFGKEVSDPEATDIGGEIKTVIDRYNAVFIRNRNRLAEKLNELVEKIE
jgi:hypothetical protein